MNANDKSWSNKTIALFDKLEAQIRQQQTEIEVLKGNIEIHKEANRNTMESLMQSRVRIDQLLETQDYLYKRHDEQQAEIDSLKDKLNLANKSLEIIEGWTK